MPARASNNPPPRAVERRPSADQLGVLHMTNEAARRESEDDPLNRFTSDGLPTMGWMGSCRTCGMPADQRRGHCDACASDTTRCDDCDAIVQRSEVRVGRNANAPIRGGARFRRVCGGCQNQYTECSSCRNVSLRSSLVTIVQNARPGRHFLICPNCTHTIRRCPGCASEFYSADGSQSCQACSGSPQERCGGCGGSVPIGAECLNCLTRYSRAVSDGGPIFEYNFRILEKAPPKEGVHLLGVELECALKDMSRSLDENARAVWKLFWDSRPGEPGSGRFAILKSDGSIGAPGYEIVTRPASLSRHRTEWQRFFDSPLRRQLLSYDVRTCGLHVHLSRAPLTPLAIGKIVILINSPCNAEFIKKMAGRGLDRWAKLQPSMRLADGLPTKPTKHGYRRRRGISACEDDRYSAVNLRNRHTVEIRIFRGTLKPASFFRCLEFCDAVVKWSMWPGGMISPASSLESFKNFAMHRTANKSGMLEWPHLRDFLAGTRSFYNPETKSVETIDTSMSTITTENEGC